MSDRDRRKLVSVVESECRAKGLVPKALAHRARCHERTVRNFLNNKPVKDDTALKIAKAAGADFNGVVSKGKNLRISNGAEYGSYSRALAENYIGNFYAYRRSFSVSENVICSLFTLFWDEQHSCLRFREYQTYHSKHLDRRVSYDQDGCVYIGDAIGLVHLLTVQKGAVRLITLTKLHHRESFMNGAVLTQSEWPDHYQPSVSAIYFRKLALGGNLEALLERVGPIEPGDADYPDISRALTGAEKGVVRFAFAP